MSLQNNYAEGALEAPVISHDPECMAQYYPEMPCKCNEAASIEKLLREDEEFQLDEKMLNHPLFQHTTDELLSKFIKLVQLLTSDKAKLEEQTREIQEYMEKKIFSEKTMEILKKEFKELGLDQKWTCQKPIKENEICFRCLDCETTNHPNFYYVMCAECFERSSHEGHRLVMLKHPAGAEISCNCGSPEAFKPEGFCPDHKYLDVDTKELIKKMPEEMAQNFQETMNKLFYGTTCLNELMYYLQDKPGYSSMKILFQVIFIQATDFVTTLSQEIGNSIFALFEVVQRDYFKSPYNQLWHDCDDFSGERNFSEAGGPRECKCTILGTFFKYGKSMENQGQIILSKLTGQSLDDIPFRRFFVIEYSKYTRYYFPQIFREDSVVLKGNAKILEYNNMIWCMEDLLALAIENGYINRYVRVLQTVVEKYTSLTEGIIETLSFLADVWSFYFNPNNPMTVEMVRKEIKETNMMSEFMQAMMTFQMKFFYPGSIRTDTVHEEIDYGFINTSQLMSLCLTYPINYAMKLIEVLPLEEKTPILKRLMSDWYQFIETVKLVQMDSDSLRSLTPLLERCLFIFIRCYTCSEFTKENVAEFFQKCLPEGVDIRELAKPIVKNLMEVFGVMRFINIIHHRDVGPFIEGYYQLDFTIFETDMTMVHIMSMFINEEELFSLLTESYFSFDAQIKEESFLEFKTPNNIKETMMEDYLSFLVFMMNDDTIQLNLNMNDKYNRINTKSPDLERVLEKVTANFLLTQYWTDIAYFKDLLFGLMFGEDFLDPIVLKLTIKDEKTHRIRIKEGYEKEIDPYIFYKNAIVMRDLREGLESRWKNNDAADLVSGKFYDDPLPQVQAFRESLFKGKLLGALSSFIGSPGASGKSFVRVVLKLILLNLQCTDDSEETKKRIRDNYMTERFNEGLGQLKKIAGLKDCQKCITKIKDFLKEEEEGLPEALNLGKQDSVREDKKKAAMDRMNKLKEEFAKKQSQFTDKNKELIIKTGEESKTASPDVLDKKGGKTCQHCLDQIDEENQLYGVPIHIGFTNNFYQVDGNAKFEELDYSNFGSIAWWPVISSCHHYFHSKCFWSALQGENPARYLYTTFYSNSQENHCSLCKTLYNSFVVLNQDNKVAREKLEAESDDNNVKILGTRMVPSHAAFILNDLKVKLSGKNHLMVPGIEIFDIIQVYSRGYDYFIESLRLSNSIEKSLTLFINFMKTLAFTFDNSVEVTEKKSLDFSFLKSLEIDMTRQKLCLFTEFHDRLIPWLGFRNYEILLSNSRVEKQNETDLLECSMQLLTEYLQYRIIEFLACLKDGPKTLADCHHYVMEKNPDLKDEILKTFLYPIQKIITTYLVNKWILSSEELPTSQSYYKALSKFNNIDNLSIDSINDFMKFVGFSNEDLYAIFQKAMSEFNVAPVEARFAVLTKILQIEKDDKKIVIRKFAPKMIKLPETYAEYNNKYFKRKCCLCKKYSNHMFTYICLICDEIFCQGYCPPHRNQVGNMNSHCKKYHLGKSVFLDMFQPMTNIINYPINGIQPVPKTYTDSMGVPIEQALGRHLDLLTLDFKKFTLNPALVEELERMVLSQNIDNECFRMLINYPPEDSIPPHNEL